jgi:hypothetical protein
MAGPGPCPDMGVQRWGKGRSLNLFLIRCLLESLLARQAEYEHFRELAPLLVWILDGIRSRFGRFPSLHTNR